MEHEMVLVITTNTDNEQDIRDAVRYGNLPYTLRCVQETSEALRVLATGGRGDDGRPNVAMVIIDILSTDMMWQELVQSIRSAYDDLPMIITTTSETIMAQALQRGIDDVLLVSTRSSYLTLLPMIIQRTLERRTILRQKLQAEEALRQSEQRHQAMFGKNRAIKLLIDPATGQIVDANPAACQFYGYSLATLLTMNIADINILSPSQIHEEMQQAKSEERMYFLFHHRLASGEIRDVEVYSGPVDTDGRSLLYSVVHDITRRKRAEEALLQTHAELERRIENRTAELVAANNALQHEVEERRHIQAALQHERDFAESLIETAQAIVLVIDSDGFIVRYNRYMERLSGYALEDVRGQNWGEIFLVAEERAAAYEWVQQSLAGDCPAGISTRLRTHNGSERIIEWNDTTLTDEHGRVIGILAIGIDITERERTATELRRQKTLLECQSETSPDGIIVVSMDGRIASFNQRLLDMWRIPPEVIATRATSDVLRCMVEQVAHPKQFLAYLHDVNTAHQTRTWAEIALSDGRIFERYSAPVEETDGTSLGRVSYYRDSTEARRAQEAYHTIVEHSLQGLVIIQDERIVFVNPAMAEMSGYTVEEMLERSPSQLYNQIHPEDRERVWRYLEDRLHGHDVPRVYDYRIIRNNGEIRWLEASVVLIHYRGRPASQGAYIDITDRKRAEEAYRTLVDHSLQGLIIVQDHRIVFANRAMSTISGYTINELLRLTSSELLAMIHGDDKERVWTYLQDRRKGKPPPSSYEYRIFRSDGRVRWLESSLVRTQYHGRPAVQATMIDCTDRKLAESDLKRRNQELAALNLVTQAVNHSLVLADILSTVKTLLANSMNITGGAISLYDEGNDRLMLRSSWALPEGMEHVLQDVAVESSYSKQVVRHHVPLLIRHPADHPSSFGHHPILDVLRPEWSSYLGIPLIAQGETQGILDLFHQNAAWPDEHQVAFFITIGHQVGAAIQRARLFDEVRAARQRLQLLSQRLVEVQETERGTIARELHDEIGQILTGVNFSLELVSRLPPEQMHQHLEQTHRMLNDLMQRVREMSLELRPPMLDDLGIIPALLWHIERYTNRTGVQVVLKHVGMEQRFAPEIETAVFRMVQEALTNIARYAGADEAVIRLWANELMLGVQIEDQGCGFDPEQSLSKHTSSGLSGMRERMTLLGGELLIESTPGHGSCLTVKLPMETTPDLFPHLSDMSPPQTMEEP